MATQPVFEPYVSAEKAADYLELSPRTLNQKAREGEIPAYPYGDGDRKTWRYKISELDNWMKNRVTSKRRSSSSKHY